MEKPFRFADIDAQQGKIGAAPEAEVRPQPNPFRSLQLRGWLVLGAVPTGTSEATKC